MIANEPSASAGFELDWLQRWALYTPSAVALQDGDTGARLTYLELYQKAVICAAILARDHEVRAGDRVVVISANELEYIVLFFALQRLGAILVPVNFRLTPVEISHIVKDSDAKLILFHPQFRASAEEVAAVSQATALPLVGEESLFTVVTKNPELLSWTHQFPEDSELPVMILYTSGTTGAPKGAILSHRMLFWNSINTSLRLNLSQKDSAVIFLPLFHTGGWNVLTTPFLHRGARVILTKKFEAEQVLNLSSQEKCTLVFGVPTTMDMMARCTSFKDCDLKSVRYAIVGGEPMPLELIQIWQEKGIPVRQGYGLTEFGPNVFSLNEEDSIKKMGSIGFPNFYTEAKIIDSKGGRAAPNEVGELLLRGPMMMKGYWKNAAATSETIQGGWLHTGDLVRQDDEGYFFIVGRKKDMFISGGENVYPVEIEKVLRALPGIREAAVIGISDPKWGEVGKAFIVKESRSTDLTEEQLREHCSVRLAKFKIPKHFMFMESLPKGDSGKILKKELI